MGIGGRIKALRKALGLTQVEFASRIKISKGFLSNLEKGIRQPSDQLILLIAHEYSSSENWLTSGEGNMFMSGEEVVINQIARLGERAYYEALQRILEGNDLITRLAVTPGTDQRDPELHRMICFLIDLWSVGDDKLKAWAQVQFDRAFPPGVLGELKKIHNRTVEESSAASDPIYYFNKPSTPSMAAEEASAYLPVLGEAAAGKPIYIDEALEGYIPVSEKYSRYRHFLIRVKGDSMVGAGIEAGDVVIVRPQPIVDEGDIAVFRIDKSGTIKYYYRQNGTIVLKSANPSYSDIIVKPGQDVAIIGKVISTIKKSDADRRMHFVPE